MTSSPARTRWWRALGWPGAARRRANPQGSMTLVEHIYELRRRLAIALAAVAVGSLLGFLWYAATPFGLPSLGGILTGPYCALPESSRLTFGPAGDCRLLATAPFEQFMLRLKVGATAGVLLASPIWLGQLWGFITPGLHKHEKRFAHVFVGCASTLFVGGAVLAFFIVSQALTFLLGVGDATQITALRGADYFSFLIALLIIFGVSFELPLLVVMLNRVGVVSYAKLASWRRGLIFGLFAFAAVATPGQDPISMLALGVSLVLLLELAIQICRVHDRRAARRREQGWGALSPDEAAPIEDTTR